MGFIALRCPQCGAEINYDNSKDFGFCNYCGSKITTEKQRVEISGTVNVDGVASLEATLERAYIFLADADFFNAKIYFNRVLDLNPKCAKAYWGLLLCDLEVENDEELRTLCVDLTKFSEFEKAMIYANEEEIRRFSDVEKETSKNMREYEQEIKKEKEKDKKYNKLYVFMFCGLMLCFLVFILMFIN